MPIIGHQKIIAYFDNALAQKNLSQSYCFVGYDGVGKRTIARRICAELLKVDETKLDRYPDFYYVSRQEDEKTGKLKKDITIAQARQIKDRVSRKSWLGDYQAVVIDEAELLNGESANALLKILEETKGQCVFFLLTTDDNSLLPTIRSRCQMFYFSLIGQKEIVSGLKDVGYEERLAEEAANLSWGRPGRAVALAADGALREIYHQEVERWENVVSQPFYKRLRVMQDFFGEKADAIRIKDRLQKAIDVWLMLWRDVMLKKFLKPAIDTRATERIINKNNMLVSEMASLIDNLKQAQVLLNQNINPRLVIEQILLKFS